MLTIRLERSALMTARVPREKVQFTCRSSPAAQRSLALLLRAVTNPSAARIAFTLLVSREYATANRYKPGGVVILGSQLPGFRTKGACRKARGRSGGTTTIPPPHNTTPQETTPTQQQRSQQVWCTCPCFIGGVVSHRTPPGNRLESGGRGTPRPEEGGKRQAVRKGRRNEPGELPRDAHSGVEVVGNWMDSAAARYYRPMCDVSKERRSFQIANNHQEKRDPCDQISNF